MNIVFNSDIKFKYYFKLNNKVKKVVIKYYDLLNLLELRNKKDNKNNGKCEECRLCWDKSIKDITYKFH